MSDAAEREVKVLESGLGDFSVEARRSALRRLKELASKGAARIQPMQPVAFQYWSFAGAGESEQPLVPPLRSTTLTGCPEPSSRSNHTLPRKSVYGVDNTLPQAVTNSPPLSGPNLAPEPEEGTFSMSPLFVMLSAPSVGPPAVSVQE